ncbi:PKD domain-containing protein [Lentzea sp. NEAU-D7]|uniref:PKD domain-containing protein n=1 Tax=Lentzea sp. NEAU-D7 TaxID=2994667 RepID=UPI00224AEB33|nr:PKD domain-containing protein [Lentzea sp. NEAU-D7]MCX2949565.1 PKD domain-containing protein [Lentzea sp. NEAU-D7]
MPSARSLAVAAAVLLGVLVPGVAQAAPPSNDDFDSATVVGSLPYAVEQDTTESTKASDDPAGCRGYSVPGSAWFRYTATEDGLLRLKTEGSDRDLNVATFTGERGDLDPVWNAFYDGCTTQRSTPLTFPAKAGTTYHFMVSGTSSAGGQVKLALDRISRLPNDDLAGAEQVTALPFSAPQPDYTRASREPNEPVASTCSGSGAPSVWYAYTPTRNHSVLMHVEGWGSGPLVTVYEGTSINDLTFLGCEGPQHYNGKSVAVTAGKTYYFQWAGGGYYSYPSTLELTESEPFQTSVYTGYSHERSIFEDVGFSLDHTNDYDDPVTTEWDFGDGTTAPPSAENHQAHRYAADGVYTVTVRSKASDGRTATDTTVVTVKTHDVGISKFTVPTSARVGEQKQISVHVSNTRHLEKVKTTVYRNNGNGWQEVGTLTIDVPAHPTRLVKFPFAHTFTPQDAVTGKVSFRAVVEPQLEYPVRDAVPSDNEVITTATTVRPALLSAAAVAN